MCLYCPDFCLDNEQHSLFQCSTFSNKRECFKGRMEALVPGFTSLYISDLLKTALCPVSPQAGKVVNKYINIIFTARKSIDEGANVNNLTFPPQVNVPPAVDDRLDQSNSSESSLSNDDASSESSSESDVSGLE